MTAGHMQSLSATHHHGSTHCIKKKKNRLLRSTHRSREPMEYLFEPPKTRKPGYRDTVCVYRVN
ncbi:hypothetical protein I7I52_04048 [Histoplasma capsulatum]|uniref:Uncharacterized protein n=1 Tax=Ajellomyces capsulatus TaxID=5037 RepID=A0A8H8D802_AJECA|nr:hypothetical protein I7I52_04048 [Histoplasma capsulatum]